MPEGEVRELANSLGAEILQVGTRPEMIQVQYRPDEFLVYFDAERNLKRVDRAKIEAMFLGLFVENAGYYEVLSCSGGSHNKTLQPKSGRVAAFHG